MKRAHPIQPQAAEDAGQLKPNLLKPRWSKVFSDLWEDKTRTGLVVASIAVGVFALGMIITAYVILGQDINHSYAITNPPNIEMTTSPFEPDFVRAIAKLPGVGQVEGRQVLSARARLGQGKWQNLRLMGAAASAAGDAGRINRLSPIEGRPYPRDGEIVVSQDMSRLTGFHPGDRIEIELPGLAARYLTVAGLVVDQTTARPEQGVTNNAYVTPKTLETLGVGSSLNQLVITVAGEGGGDKDYLAGVAEQVKDQVERSHRQVYSKSEYLSTEHPAIKSILAVIGVLGALGGLVTILSTSLIVNTLNALLAQQLRQIGIMKLVGGRSFQIMGMYLLLIIAYGVIALLLAVPLGAMAGYSLAAYIARLMGAVLQGFRLIPAAVVTQALIATLVPLGAGFLPVSSGARTTIQRAISNYRPGDQKVKSSFLNLNARWLGWVSRPLLLSFRNTFRKKGRLLLTIFTLSVAGAVFIAVFNARDSMNHVVDQIMRHFMGDVTLEMRQPYRVNKIELALREVPGVVAVEAWGGAMGEIWASDALAADDQVVSKLTILAPPNDTRLLHPDFVAGRGLLPGEKNALVISDAIYDFYPNLKPGDRLNIKLSGERVEAWTVVGIFRFVVTLGDPIAYANFEFLGEKTHSLNQAASFRITTALHDADSQRVLTETIDRSLRQQNFLVGTVLSGAAMQADASRAINTLIIFLLIMAILTAFVGSIGLMGTMSINVLERTREIGVMRTIGAEDRVVMGSVMIEALVIGLITWLLAVGLSFPISYLLLAIIGAAMMGSAISLSMTPFGILLWLGVVIGLSLFASIVPARSAARLTINEVLAYE